MTRTAGLIIFGASILSLSQSPLLPIRHAVSMKLVGTQTEVTRLLPTFVLDEWQRPLDETGPIFLAQPSSVAIRADGNIFVLDTQNRRVVEFDADGNFKAAIGKAGQAPGEFVFLRNYAASDLAVGGTRLGVFDPIQHRLSVFDSYGNFLGSYASPRTATSLDLDENYAYLSVTVPEGQRGPQFIRVSLQDFSARPFGEAVLRSPASHHVRFLSYGYLATNDRGEVFHALQDWPVISKFSVDSLLETNIADRGLWRGFAPGPLDEIYAAFAQLLEGTGPKPGWLPKYSLVLDLEHVPGLDLWAVLLNGNLVELFDNEGTLQGSFRLLAADDGFVDFYGFTDIAVGHAGDRICAADATRWSVVVCYDTER